MAMKTEISFNRKAYFDYEILDSFEAGIVLSGDEVKSLRAGQVSLIGAFATVHGNELYLINCRISPYEKAFQKKEDDASRRRKLLLHRRELDKIIGDISKKGITIVPLKLYFSPRGLIKVQLGLGKHKKASDQRQSIKERDIKRETSREIRGKY
jgi:SsrA-binding protein